MLYEAGIKGRVQDVEEMLDVRMRQLYRNKNFGDNASVIRWSWLYAGYMLIFYSIKWNYSFDETTVDASFMVGYEMSKAVK